MQHRYGVNTWHLSTPFWRVVDCTNLVHVRDMIGGERIAAERKARGMNRPELARLMGTTPQQVERLEKGQRRLSEDWLNRAATAFGIPTTALLSDESPQPPAEAVKPNASPFLYEGASMTRAQENLPLFGTALGATRQFEGEAIEQTTLNSGDIVRYVTRPTVLNGRGDVYGLYVQGHSMEPAHSAGAMLIAEQKRPPRIGDDVVVYLRPDGEDDDGERARAVLVKRLVKRGTTWIELEQFNPPLTFRLEKADFVRIDRVMLTEDLLG